MTLLEQAKKTQTKRCRKHVTEEEIKLAIAWIKGEVQTIQTTEACQLTSSGNAVYRMALCLREAYLRGLIKIK